jgi:hypothetical protein
MKGIRAWSAIGIVSLFCSLCLPAQQARDENADLNPASAPGPVNFNAIAILRWYSANLTTNFDTGIGPEGIAFDGAHIWVANFSGNDVTELEASDGALLGTFNGGSSPVGVAFDGANIWVANSGGNNVTKLRASDGRALGSFDVGSSPVAVAFDGSDIWVANGGSGNVTKLRARDGKVLGGFKVGTGPAGIAFDGVNVWVANFGSSDLTKLRARSSLAMAVAIARAARALGCRSQGRRHDESISTKM